MDFTIPPQWDEGQDMVFEATFADDKLTGTVVRADGKKFNWTGVRAPELMEEQRPPGERRSKYSMEKILPDGTRGREPVGCKEMEYSPARVRVQI